VPGSALCDDGDMIRSAVSFGSALAGGAIRRAGDAALGLLDVTLASRVAAEAVDRAVASGLVDRAIERALDEGIVERAVDRVFDEGRVVDEAVTRLIESEDLWILVNVIAQSPAVTDAIARQSVGFADQVAGGVRKASRQADSRLEQAARRALRRPPRPVSPEQPA
jgi:hypothetical protein